MFWVLNRNTSLINLMRGYIYKNESTALKVSPALCKVEPSPS